MDIDIIKLEDKIEDLLSKVPSAKSVTEYKYLVLSLRNLNDLHNDLTGNYYKVSTLGNRFCNKYIDSESNNTIINKCFSDSAFNSKLAYRLLKIYYDDKSFYEFYSEFVEMLFYDYVREKNIKRRDALFSENAMLASLEYCLVDLYDAYELRNLSINEDTLDIVSDAYEYSYGIVLAMYMANRYYEDKEDVRTRCNEFMYMQGLNDSTKELNTLGITKDELLSGHALEKRLVRHNSDMKNIFLR